MLNCQLLIDYVYLDSEERKRFAQASHEYLIEQLQFTGSESLTSTTNKYRLNFNHPSKYLIWAPHLDRYNSRNLWAVHALLDGSWTKSLEKLAKIVTLSACEASTDLADGITRVSVVVSATSDPSASGVFQLDGTHKLGSGAMLDSMIADANDTLFSDVYAKAYSADERGTTNVWDVVVGQGVTLAAAWTDAFNNCIVKSTDLDSIDMSYTVEQLTAGVACPAVDDNEQVNLIDQFNYANFIDHSDNPCIQGKLQLNGHDRFQVLDGYYFNYVQPYQHFDNTPADGINVYSFALKAQDHQPTGTCNFSRIDNATLQVDLGVQNDWATASALGENADRSSARIYTDNFLGANASLLNIYTVNYNVLRVMSEEIWSALMIYQSLINIKYHALKSSTLIQTTYKNKEKSLVECLKLIHNY